MMLELFETESGTIIATYNALDEALEDIQEEIRAGGRVIARTWALGQHRSDGSIVCIAHGDALADLVQTLPATSVS